VAGKGCGRGGFTTVTAFARRPFPWSRPAFRPRGAPPGFTAVELLLACVIAGLALAAAWSWLFSSAAAGGREQRRLEAETSLAFVERLTAAELRRAAQLLASPAPGCSERSVTFIVLDDDGMADTVTYVWNPATRVLWRKAPGSHLASDVESFAIGYLDGDGAVVTPAGGSFSLAELARVRGLRLSLVLSCGKGQVEASWRVTPRGTR
jgi:type II secretory pathway pseudopilin PulG